MISNINNISIKSETSIAYYGLDGKIRIGRVINMSENLVDDILYGKIYEKSEDISLSCITEKGCVNIGIDRILGTIDNNNGFSI